MMFDDFSLDSDRKLICVCAQQVTSDRLISKTEPK